jgi:hypothetical protein
VSSTLLARNHCQKAIKDLFRSKTDKKQQNREQPVERHLGINATFRSTAPWTTLLSVQKTQLAISRDSRQAKLAEGVQGSQ